MTTSRLEIRDILIAYLVLTFDLVLILGGTTVIAAGPAAGSSFNASIVGLAAAAALTGFLAHELAHKVAAQRRHCWAEFRMFPMGLVLSVFTAFIGFLFAAPGATMVGGMYDLRSWGRTSLAGPAINLVFAASFFARGVRRRVSRGERIRALRPHDPRSLQRLVRRVQPHSSRTAGRSEGSQLEPHRLGAGYDR